jgi:myo-inositol-1(or 4)-monophosphatase
VGQNLEKLTLAVCEIARRAGAYIKGEREKFSLESVERKHAHDYVSYVDKGSEQLIVAALKELLPDAGFITEEGLAGHGAEQLLWVVDPLDGTTNFIHQYAPYAVSIALLGGKDILIGVVYEICADECFYAWKGGGAYVDGKPLHVSSQKIQDALLCLQLPYNSDAYKPTIKRLIDTFYGNVGSIRMCGSAAMALCYVAAGRLDGYAEQYIGQWDFMAGSLIVMEAGGTVTDYSGSSDFTQGNSVIATNGIIQNNLLDVVFTTERQS